MGDGGVRRLSKRLSDDLVARMGSGSVDSDGDMQIYRYGANGAFDPELYRAVQTEANRMKIDNQWVPEAHIKILADYLTGAGIKVARGICHGTRRGNEQLWFRSHLPGADVFGTEISDTATDFPHTIQWDFHDVDPDWIGRFDFVYSNSWDHAHDPERAFRGWIDCLAPGGALLLDHGWNYMPERVSAMDPFGISEDGLIAMLDRIGGGAVRDVIEGGSHGRLPIRTIVFRKPAA